MQTLNGRRLTPGASTDQATEKAISRPRGSRCPQRYRAAGTHSPWLRTGSRAGR